MTTAATHAKEKLVRVTAWVPQKKLRTLMKEKGARYNQSEILRLLVDNELERIRSMKAHERVYGTAQAGDLDDRLL